MPLYSKIDSLSHSLYLCSVFFFWLEKWIKVLLHLFFFFLSFAFFHNMQKNKMLHSTAFVIVVLNLTSYPWVITIKISSCRTNLRVIYLWMCWTVLIEDPSGLQVDMCLWRTSHKTGGLNIPWSSWEKIWREKSSVTLNYNKILWVWPLKTFQILWAF